MHIAVGYAVCVIRHTIDSKVSQMLILNDILSCQSLTCIYVPLLVHVMSHLHIAQKVPEHLIQDLSSPSISLSTCTSLHRDLVRRAEDPPLEPSSKRTKLDPTLAVGSSLPVHTQVAVCNAVRATLDGFPVQPPFWKLFLSPNFDTDLYQFLFHVSPYTYVPWSWFFFSFYIVFLFVILCVVGVICHVYFCHRCVVKQWVVTQRPGL